MSSGSQIAGLEISDAAAGKRSLRGMVEEIARVLTARPLAERCEPFTLGELAARWHCSVRQVERLTESGALKSFKPGRHRLVRPAAVARYEATQEGAL